MPKIVAYQNKISTCTFLDHGVVTFNELLIVGNYIRFGALVPPWLHPVFRLYQVAKNLCSIIRLLNGSNKHCSYSSLSISTIFLDSTCPPVTPSGNSLSGHD